LKLFPLKETQPPPTPVALIFDEFPRNESKTFSQVKGKPEKRTILQCLHQLFNTLLAHVADLTLSSEFPFKLCVGKGGRKFQIKAFDYENDDERESLLKPALSDQIFMGNPKKIPPIFKFHLLNLIKSFMKNFGYEL
jgi:hypothetical protein